MRNIARNLGIKKIERVSRNLGELGIFKFQGLTDTIISRKDCL